jgi:HSP20 family protein
MSSLVRIDPFRDLMTFRTAMDRLFDETVGQPGPAFAGLAAPAVDLFQTAEEVVIKASLPGVDPKEIHISVTGDVLTLRGEVREERDVEGAQYHVKERRFGGFARSIGLPTAVVADRADAQFEHGVLTLKLPKAEEVKPKTITVRAR